MKRSSKPLKILCENIKETPRVSESSRVHLTVLKKNRSKIQSKTRKLSFDSTNLIRLIDTNLFYFNRALEANSKLMEMFRKISNSPNNLEKVFIHEIYETAASTKAYFEFFKKKVYSPNETKLSSYAAFDVQRLLARFIESMVTKVSKMILNQRLFGFLQSFMELNMKRVTMASKAWEHPISISVVNQTIYDIFSENFGIENAILGKLVDLGYLYSKDEFYHFNGYEVDEPDNFERKNLILIAHHPKTLIEPNTNNNFKAKLKDMIISKGQSRDLTMNTKKNDKNYLAMVETVTKLVSKINENESANLIDEIKQSQDEEGQEETMDKELFMEQEDRPISPFRNIESQEIPRAKTKIQNESQSSSQMFFSKSFTSIARAISTKSMKSTLQIAVKDLALVFNPGESTIIPPVSTPKRKSREPSNVHKTIARQLKFGRLMKLCESMNTTNYFERSMFSSEMRNLQNTFNSFDNSTANSFVKPVSRESKITNHRINKSLIR